MNFLTVILIAIAIYLLLYFLFIKKSTIYTKKPVQIVIVAISAILCIILFYEYIRTGKSWILLLLALLFLINVLVYAARLWLRKKDVR